MKYLAFIFCFFLVSCGNNPPPNGDNNAHATNTASAAQIDNGKDLFISKCASCHGVNINLTGPALKGVEERWTSKANLTAFIHNSEAVIAEDAYAKDLFNKYNKVQMTAFPNLSDTDITSILAYIKSASQ